MARVVYRKWPEVVTNPYFPRALLGAYIEELKVDPETYFGWQEVCGGPIDPMEPDFREKLLTEARGSLRNGSASTA